MTRRKAKRKATAMASSSNGTMDDGEVRRVRKLDGMAVRFQQIEAQVAMLKREGVALQESAMELGHLLFDGAAIPLRAGGIDHE